MLFYTQTDFKIAVLKFLADTSKRELKGIIIICLIGIVCILIGFPIMIYEIALGFIIRDFWLALLLMSIVKIIGFTIAFLIARYCFKERLEEYLKFNVYF